MIAVFKCRVCKHHFFWPSKHGRDGHHTEEKP